MELEVSRQGLSLLSALLTGAVCALSYDVLRPLRKLRCSTADALFALICFVSAFLLGQGVCGGRLGVFEILALGLGFYIWRKLKCGRS